MKKFLVLIIAVALAIPSMAWAEENLDICPEWISWFCGNSGGGSSGGGAGGTWPPSGGGTPQCSEGEVAYESEQRDQNGNLLFCTWVIRCEAGRWVTGPASCS